MREHQGADAGFSACAASSPWYASLVRRVAALALVVAAAVAMPRVAHSASAGPSVQQGTPTLVGTWNWVSGQTLVVRADSTILVYDGGGRQINTGRWTHRGGNSYRLQHQNGGYVDDITLSSNGMSIDGRNNEGFALRATRRDGAPMVYAPPPVPAANTAIAGTWNWVSGQTLIIGATGSLQVFDGSGQQINSGSWTSLGGARYRFSHRTGGYVDDVTLSTDGNTIDGRNNQGASLHGTRRSGAAATNAPTAGGGSIIGTWEFTGWESLVIAADGSFRLYLNGGEPARTGRWSRTGPNRFSLAHRNPAYTDDITLSADGQTFEGSNELGGVVEGRRRSGSTAAPAGGAVATAAAAPSIAGTWNWVSGQTLVIGANGAIQVLDAAGQQINSGTLTNLGNNRYRLTHRSGGFVDEVTISNDGMTLDGTNNQGFRLRGTRRGNAPAPVAPAPPKVVGTWNWVSGQTLVVQAGGSCTVYDGSGAQINTCTWVAIGTDRYRLTHRNGGYVDEITVSANGSSLDGVNNQGFRLRGTRR